MMRSLYRLLLALPLATIACGPPSGAGSAADAEKAPVPLVATVLDGPFASTEEFCKKLNAGVCEERSDVVTLIGHDPLATKSGVSITALTMASRDKSAQRGHVLLKRGAELFALPPILEYNPDDGGKHEASVNFEPVFDDEPPYLVKITYMVWQLQKGGGPSDTRDYFSGKDICSVAAGKPIACVRVKTTRALHNVDAKKGELPGVENVVTIKGLDVSTIVLDQGPPSKEFRSEILADGHYKQVFP